MIDTDAVGTDYSGETYSQRRRHFTPIIIIDGVIQHVPPHSPNCVRSLVTVYTVLPETFTSDIATTATEEDSRDTWHPFLSYFCPNVHCGLRGSGRRDQGPRTSKTPRNQSDPQFGVREVEVTSVERGPSDPNPLYLRSLRKGGTQERSFKSEDSFPPDP